MKLCVWPGTPLFFDPLTHTHTHTRAHTRTRAHAHTCTSPPLKFAPVSGGCAGRGVASAWQGSRSHFQSDSLPWRRWTEFRLGRTTTTTTPTPPPSPPPHFVKPHSPVAGGAGPAPPLPIAPTEPLESDQLVWNHHTLIQRMLYECMVYIIFQYTEMKLHKKKLR